MSEEIITKTIEEFNQEKTDHANAWKERWVKLIIFILVSIFFSILIVSTQSSITLRIGNFEPEMPVSEPPQVFMYPFSDPEFLTVGDIRLVYEFVSEDRHLVAIDDGEDSYIMPMFKSRDQAVSFMISYFDYLRSE